MDQKREYWADSSSVERRASFWTDSTKSAVWMGRVEDGPWAGAEELNG